MTVVAATLAGGTNNQDRYVLGDTFAIVLDGATSIVGDRSHDPGWYAEQLGDAIAQRVVGPGPLGEVVEEAIRSVRDRHQLTPETSPTSTVAIARWTNDAIETYVLGDSTVVLLMTNGVELVRTDDRIAAVAPDIRSFYRHRLAQRHGFDGAHAQLLVELQRRELRARNTAKGYPIAGAIPEAGREGMSWYEELGTVQAAILASDGVAPNRNPFMGNWTAIHQEVERHGAACVLRNLHDAEAADPQGSRWPRSKLHDDKTLVVVGRRENGQPL